MRSRHYLKAALLILLMMTMAGACVVAPTTVYAPPESYYYVSPSTTYLRDCPSYECTIVATVFSGDRVQFLDSNDYGWSRVSLLRSGAVGWIPSSLLSLSPISVNYYVATSTVYLRECASYNCRSLQLLTRGDRIEKLDQDNRGWWRVMSYRTRTQGWVPASTVSPSPGPPYYYVAINALNLRAGPSTNNRIIMVLSLNDKQELYSVTPSGWAQVRDLRTGIIGWVAYRYLETFPVRYPRAAPRKHRAPAKHKEPPPAKPATPKVM